MNGPGRFLRRWALALRLAARSAWRFRSRTWMAVALLAVPGTILVAVSTTLWTLTSAPALVQMWLGHDQEVQAEITPVAKGPITQDTAGSSHTGEGIDTGAAVADGALPGVVPEGDDLVAVDIIYGATFTLRSSRRGTAGGAQQTEGVLFQTSDTRVPSVQVPHEGSLAAGEALVPDAVLTRTGARIGGTLHIEARLRAGEHTQDVAADVRITGGTGNFSSVVVGSGTFDIERSHVWDRASTTWYVLGPSGLESPAVQELNSHGFLVTSRAVVAQASASGQLHPEGLGPVSLSGLDSSALTQWPVPLVLAAVLAELVVLAGPVATVAQRRDARAMALLSVSGGDDRDRWRIGTAWGVMVGLAAGLASVSVGLAAAVVACRVHEGVTVLSIPFLVLLPAILLGLLLGVLVAVWPAHEAARMDVVAALEGRPSRGSRMVVRRPEHLVVLAGGFTLEVGAALGGRPRLFMVGALLVLLGLVQLVPGVVRVSGTLGRGGPLTWRIAMRDAVRMGHRTYPALVAMVSVVFIGSSCLVWTTTSDRVQWASSARLGSPGQVLVTAADLSARDWDSSLEETVVAALDSGPGAVSTATLRGALAATGPDGVRQEVSAVVPPSAQCPLLSAGHGASLGGHREDLEDDPRCWPMSHSLPVLDPWTSGGLSPAFIVDDGTYLEAAGLVDSDRDATALATLRAGGVLVTDPRAVVDGQATVHALKTVSRVVPDTEPQQTAVVGVPTLSEDLTLPAATWQDLGVMVLSPQAAHELGLVVHHLATLVTTRHPTGVLSAEQVSQDLEEAAPGATVTVIQSDARTVLVPAGIVVSTLLVVFLVVAMVVVLSAPSTRASLRSLRALGASPTQLRWITLDQGLVLLAHAVPTGLLAGIVTGLLATRCTVRPTSVVAAEVGLHVPVVALVTLLGVSAVGSVLVVTALHPHPARDGGDTP